eukprot:251653_1
MGQSSLHVEKMAEKESSFKMSDRQKALVSGYVRHVGLNQDVIPVELFQIIISYYLLYGDAFMFQALNVMGDYESYFIVSSPKLFGKDNLPFSVSFDIRFMNKPTQKGWPHNIGFHGGLYLGLQSDEKSVNRWTDINPRTIIDWSDHMSWIPDTKGGYRLYINHGINAHLKLNPKYVINNISLNHGCLLHSCNYENDGKYANWKIIYDRDGKATFSVNDEVIFNFVPVSYDGFVGFWQLNKIGVSVRNLIIAMIV